MTPRHGRGPRDQGCRACKPRDHPHIYEKEVNETAKCNLLRDIINRTRIAKNLKSHYSTIMHVCMNTRKGKLKFKNFQILLKSGSSPTIVIGRLFEKYILRKMLLCSGLQKLKILLLKLGLN